MSDDSDASYQAEEERELQYLDVADGLTEGL